MNYEFGRIENKSLMAYFSVQSQQLIQETGENYVQHVSIFTPGPLKYKCSVSLSYLRCYY
jgi:hypothetical protein